MTEDLINVSDLNQYLYCPRRYWYFAFYDTMGMNYYRKDGKSKHDNKADRGGWISELYLESEALGLKGRIDVLDAGEHLLPIERKRGGDFYYNDEIQLAGYCLLLKDYLQEEIREGVIYLYGRDQRVHVVITEEHQEKVEECIQDMRDMTPDSPPPFTDNPNKCEKCSTREYCMPAETAKLEPEKARGTGWEDHA